MKRHMRRADFFHKTVADNAEAGHFRDPLDGFWTQGWEFTLDGGMDISVEAKRYGDSIRGSDLLHLDPLLYEVMCAQLSQAVHTAYEQGYADGRGEE